MEIPAVVRSKRFAVDALIILLRFCHYAANPPLISKEPLVMYPASGTARYAVHGGNLIRVSIAFQSHQFKERARGQPPAGIRLCINWTQLKLVDLPVTNDILPNAPWKTEPMPGRST